MYYYPRNIEKAQNNIFRAQKKLIYYVWVPLVFQVCKNAYLQLFIADYIQTLSYLDEIMNVSLRTSVSTENYYDTGFQTRL